MPRFPLLAAILTTLALHPGCYAPDLRDCTVTCSGAADCAGGQVCGADGFCAAADVAGTCSQAHGVDAGPVPMVVLHIQVMGNGKVDITGGGTCSSAMGPGDCMISVPRGMVELKAVTLDDTKPFDRWSSATCAGQPATCTLTALIPTTVAAKFH